MTAEEWFLPEGDVHVRIFLAGLGFDYRATAAAVHNLLLDWKRARWCTIELVNDAIDNCRLLPRLPCEELFLGP